MAPYMAGIKAAVTAGSVTSVTALTAWTPIPPTPMLTGQPTVLASTHQPARATCCRSTSHCNTPSTVP